MTPALFALVYVSGVYRVKKTLATAGPWPWWPQTASMISCLVWGLSVPESPYYSAGVAALLGVVALLVSAALTLLDPAFDR